MGDVLAALTRANTHGSRLAASDWVEEWHDSGLAAELRDPAGPSGLGELPLIGNGNGYGDDYGDGYGDGNGYGDDYGGGYGDGNGYGYGYGNGYGYGYGYGDGNGYGNGDGNGRPY